jgi:ribosomal protein S18 acetylase RimI-like enzyme
MTNETTSSLRVRRAEPRDRNALYEICLLTADGGIDATTLYSDPKLPGYLWAAPYGELEPDFAFVLADNGPALGYVIAAADTAAFEVKLEREWWPMVRKAVAGMTPKASLDQAALSRIQNPEVHAEWLVKDYPAHLHINLLPEAQSGGWGRRLIETEIDALRRAGVRGVHLGVSPTNERAKGFYSHLGFEDISRDGRIIYGMRFR